MQEILENLKKLTGKKHIQLTERGNKAIQIALDLASQLEKTTVLIPDQGGWLTYKKYPKKFDLKIKEIKTKQGLLDLEDLKKHAKKDSILLTSSMQGYFAVDNMDEIMKIASKKGCLVVNDVSGSIGTDAAKVGNLLIGSFGKWKPLNLEYGGFIATDEDEFYENFDASYFDEHMYEDLIKKFEELPARLENFKKTRAQILDDLQSFSIIHKDKDGINVIIKFDDEEVKQRIIDYCKENKLAYTECPRYIRVNEKAISVEVKRL
ncbi:DegT/DnrJ/EryC1/StrS family aminotransferase [Candidatus Woesearchaeota archaeon]|nr:DegT/DnrJ/EryC1/StrS family aminotransferase [Candidatus Woesearchaeota archaeon]